MPSSRFLLGPLLAASLLASCASTRPSAPAPVRTAPTPSAPAPSPAPFPATIEPAPAASTPAQPAPPDAPVLAAEYDWLQQLFGPTPVRLAMGSDGSITLRVPMQHAFDADAPQPKPPLLAVLGKLGESMHRQPQATLLAQVPGAEARVSAVRDALAAQGISPDRVIGASAPQGTPEVLLQLVP